MAFYNIKNKRLDSEYLVQEIKQNIEQNRTEFLQGEPSQLY